MDVTYLDIGHTTLMCYWGQYGLHGHHMGNITTWVITGWTIRMKGWWLMVHTLSAGWRGFSLEVGIEIWVTAVGHMEPFRAQLGKTLLGIWCWPAFKWEDETETIHSKWVCDLSVRGGSISVVSQQWWSKNGWNWCGTSVGLLWIFVWQAAYSCSIEVISNRKPWRGQCHCLLFTSLQNEN